MESLERLRLLGASALLAALALSLGGCSVPGNGAGSPAGERPNVLLIVTDDQRAGETLEVMPNVRRRFFAEGVRMQSATASTPLCCPSRGSIFTGRYVHNHGVRTNMDAERLDQETTLQHHLGEAGYETAIFGKYLNRWDLRRDPPHFDRFGIFGGGHFDVEANVDGEQRRVPGFSTDFVGEEARRFLADRDPDEPFFLTLAPFVPHGPFTPEERYAKAPVPEFQGNPAVDEDDKSDKPPYVQRAAEERRPHRGQDSDVAPLAAKGRAASVEKRARQISAEIPRQQLRMVKSADDLVGAVFAELERTGEADNTIAFFVSDNGYLWGEHGLSAKGAPYTQSIEVPMAMRWPQRIRGGRGEERLAANVDIAPTVLDAVGLAPPTPVDGRSLLDRTWRRERALTEFFFRPPAADRRHARAGGRRRAPPLGGPRAGRGRERQGRRSAPGRAERRRARRRGRRARGLGAMGPGARPPTRAAGRRRARRGPGTWASLRTRDYQYVEYYGPDDRTVTFREYYDLRRDPWQLENVLGDETPDNDPDVERLSAQLARDRRCSQKACP